MDCGPTCLRMIAAHYGRELPLQRIRSMSKTTREGSSLLGLSTAAEDLAAKQKAVAEKATVIEFSPEALGVRAMAKEFNVKLKPLVEWLITHHIFRRNKYGNLCLTDRYEKCTDSFQISTFKRWNMEEPSVSVRVTAKGRKIIWDAIQPDISEMRKTK